MTVLFLLFTASYFGGTSTGTQFTGSAASFLFYGSAVWLFGSQDASHGVYNVTLDGVTSTFNGGTAATTIYTTPIFSATGLTLGNHSVSLANAQTNNSRSLLVDLDYIMWQNDIEPEADTAVIEDTMSAFVYEPPDAWTTDPQNISKSSNGTAHQTVTNGAYVTFTFSAESVVLYGSAGPAMSGYSVQLDNGNPIMYNATRSNSYEGVPLFVAAGLSAGVHMLKVVNLPTTIGLGLSIDFASIQTTNRLVTYHSVIYTFLC
ncbi:hypothetical protein BD410DRAFT_732703 [Rickenella mellea]|uniref:Uncharacterized protein n=1 Tax=Rickenella mellea TaxID=50990 RepID=A0A4Y7PJ32_9AGAM|nr:hypothetical protein BD410DRAFT_732703 [Rickenella mellea]